MPSKNSGTPTVPKSSNSATLAHFTKECCIAGGEIIRNFPDDIAVREKSPRDYVTAVDEKVQKEIWKKILGAYSNSRLLGEESGSESDPSRLVSPGDLSVEHILDWPDANSLSASDFDDRSELVWIIDPIDGTANFIHNIPYYAVSIAAALRGRIVAGAVLDVCSGQCFWAIHGEAAHVEQKAKCEELGFPTTENGLKTTDTSTSDCHDISDAMLAISLPCQLDDREAALRKVVCLTAKSANIRRFGSAALNVCNVACGRLDGYWAGSLCLWDIAAAAFILKQSGGWQQITALEDPWRLEYRSAANETIADQMNDCLKTD